MAVVAAHSWLRSNRHRFGGWGSWGGLLRATAIARPDRCEGPRWPPVLWEEGAEGRQSLSLHQMLR